MKRWISFPRCEGVFSRQAHVDLPQGAYEREIGREGFWGPATHMYHRHPPTQWESIAGPLRPRAFDTNLLPEVANCPWHAGVLLRNRYVSLRWWRCTERMGHLVRNADGDELVFVHEGAGRLFCDYGHLPYAKGDYVVLPRGTMWRIEPGEPTAILLVEATGSGYQLPERGMLGAHAVFDPGVLDTPVLDDVFETQIQESIWEVHVKARGQISRIAYAHNPLDALGWKGNLAPVRLHWRDIRPVVSARYHLPPSVHTTFVGERFVVCTFCPRPMESEKGALKVPFYHSNDDYDEVIFYHRGNFFSRDDVCAGMMTHHPFGVPHGPHPKAYQASLTTPRRETDEVAVMIDTRDALEATDLAMGIEQVNYVRSWSVR